MRGRIASLAGRGPNRWVVVQIGGRGPNLRVVVQGRARASAQRWREDVSAGAGAVRAAEIRLLMGAVTLLAARRVGGATLGVRRELLRCRGAGTCTQALPLPRPFTFKPQALTV
jgi:hypothetical protein